MKRILAAMLAALLLLGAFCAGLAEDMPVLEWEPYEEEEGSGQDGGETEAPAEEEAGEAADDETLFNRGIELIRRINDPDSVRAAQKAFDGITSGYQNASLFKNYSEAVLSIHEGDMDGALLRLELSSREWRGEKARELKLAAGFALARENPGLSAEKLVRQADLAMYEAKAEYYRSTGLDRRRPQ